MEMPRASLMTRTAASADVRSQWRPPCHGLSRRSHWRRPAPSGSSS